jgi:hypothetical protein
LGISVCYIINYSVSFSSMSLSSFQYSKEQLRNAVKENDLDLAVKILVSNPRWVNIDLSERSESNSSQDQVRK